MTNDVLESQEFGPWNKELIRSDAVERVMPLTRPGLPEQLQGLFWMDQWGLAGHSDIGCEDCLIKSAGDFSNQTNCLAAPSLLTSFAGMPFVAEGDTWETLMPTRPTDVANWAWFGVYSDNYNATHDPSASPNLYKFVFNAACTKASIISSAAMNNPSFVSYTMEQQDANTWARRSFLTPNHVGPSFDYTAHRIVDGQGKRLPKYDDYLAMANRPIVSGTKVPNSVMVFRRPGAVDNSAVAGMLPAEGAWPEPVGHLAEFVEDALGTMIAGLLKRVRGDGGGES